MKVVALISGGKDSCYNMMQCIAAGHEIVALANLQPEKKDELDSYMYQTVGHEAIDLYAEAMDLPMYRRTIQGTSLVIGKDYNQQDGDEVEDLYQLLKLVKEKEIVEGVSVGAILSDYQRVRVEHVCQRLGLQPLAYLWRRCQEDLLREMISSNIHALIIKVAAFGLDPEKHLGKTLAEMESYLQQLSKKYGVHVCGEGGEYETLTLDCPLFKKKIVIDSSKVVVHSADAFAPVGYLQLLKMHLEDKPNHSYTKTVSGSTCPCMSYIKENRETFESLNREPTEHEICATASLDNEDKFLPCSLRANLGYQWICVGVNFSSDKGAQDQARHVFSILKDMVEAKGFRLSDAVLIHLYLKSMSDFIAVNAIYKTFFGLNPPARVCVEAPMFDGEHLKVDCLLHSYETSHVYSSVPQKQIMHVQSVSHWAPANIGPYSQAIKINDAIFCAGQIGLIPCTMQLVQGGVQKEAILTFSHVEKVLDAMNSGLTLRHVLMANCYAISKIDIPLIKKIWEKCTTEDDSYGEEKKKCSTLVVSVVPRLPRNAAVELHVIAANDNPRERQSFSLKKNLEHFSIECEMLKSSCSALASISLSVSLLSPEVNYESTEEVLECLVTTLKGGFEKLGNYLSVLCCRTFYKHSNKAAVSLLEGFGKTLRTWLEERQPAFISVPVVDLPDMTILHIACWLSQ
ncbi:diphthine--ammonia ligase [Erpetoichthys calabaricus]|uniref:diphthine--ammonia ligase n=1 Tax=Erpetoichthys calabaricus TaxID=27687 RepID=UPI002234A648|nr:diphthine--ammonia ligase [Erpetoichthys calabaricus]